MSLRNLISLALASVAACASEPVMPDGLVLWLRADKGIETDGVGLVRRWIDQSGNGNHAESFTEMGRALREGIMQADARKNKPALSSTKLENFAAEFAQVFQSQN